MFLRFIHTSMYQYFTSFYCYIILHLMATHSSVDEYFICFDSLVILNNATMNTCLKVLCEVKFSFCFGYIHRSGIPGSYAKYVLPFQKLFSKTAVPFYIPTSNVPKGCNFSISLPTLLKLLCFLFITAIQMGNRWYLIMVFICISLTISDYWGCFHVLTGNLYTFLKKGLLKSIIIFGLDHLSTPNFILSP